MIKKNKFKKLQRRITEIFHANVNFAILMEMSHSTLTGKLKDTGIWRSDEIEKAIELLQLKKEDIPEYFF